MMKQGGKYLACSLSSSTKYLQVGVTLAFPGAMEAGPELEDQQRARLIVDHILYEYGAVDTPPPPWP